MTFTKNLTEIVLGKPSGGGVKHKRGSQVYIAISDLSTAIGYLGNGAR